MASEGLSFESRLIGSTILVVHPGEQVTIKPRVLSLEERVARLERTLRERK